jgi:hypothetical protein
MQLPRHFRPARALISGALYALGMTASFHFLSGFSWGAAVVAAVVSGVLFGLTLELWFARRITRSAQPADPSGTPD